MLFSRSTKVKPTRTDELIDALNRRNAEALIEIKNITIEKVAGLLAQVHDIYPNGPETVNYDAKKARRFIDTIKEFAKLDPKHIRSAFANNNGNLLEVALLRIGGKDTENTLASQRHRNQVLALYTVLDANLAANPQDLTDDYKKFRDEALSNKLQKIIADNERARIPNRRSLRS